MLCNSLDAIGTVKEFKCYKLAVSCATVSEEGCRMDGWVKEEAGCMWTYRLEERCVKSRRGLEGFIEWYNIALQMLLPLIVNVTEIHLHFASQNEAAQCCFSVLSAPSPSQLRLSSNNNLQWRKWSLHLGYQYSIHSYS